MMYFAALTFFGGLVIGEFWILVALINKFYEERQKVSDLRKDVDYLMTRISQPESEIIKLKNEITRLSIRIGKLVGKENK